VNGTPSAANNLAESQTNKNAEIRYPIDGTLSTRDYPEIYHSAQPSAFGYWLLDLGQAYKVDSIVYYNRPGYTQRAIGMLIETYDKNYNINSPGSSVALNQFTLNGDLIQTLNL